MAGIHRNLKSITVCVVAALTLLTQVCCGAAEETRQKERRADYSTLISHLSKAGESMDQVEADLEAMKDDELAAFIAAKWQEQIGRAHV